MKKYNPTDLVYILAQACIQVGCVTEVRTLYRAGSKIETSYIVEAFDPSCPDGFSRGRFSESELARADGYYEAYDSPLSAWKQGPGKEALAYAKGVAERLEREAREEDEKELAASAAA